MLIVTLLDGHVVALDQHTGRVLWTFDSGAPLVSAKQNVASSQGLNVFPGTDGGLYAYHGITHLNPGLEVCERVVVTRGCTICTVTVAASVALGRVCRGCLKECCILLNLHWCTALCRCQL